MAESSIDTQICEALPRITEKLRQSQNHAVDQQIPASIVTMQVQLEDLLNGRRPVYLSTKPFSSAVPAVITASPDAASTNSPVLVSAAIRAANRRPPPPPPPGVDLDVTPTPPQQNRKYLPRLLQLQASPKIHLTSLPRFLPTVTTPTECPRR